MTDMAESYRRDQQRIGAARTLRAAIAAYRLLEHNSADFLDPELKAVEEGLKRRDEQLQATWN